MKKFFQSMVIIIYVTFFLGCTSEYEKGKEMLQVGNRDSARVYLERSLTSDKFRDSSLVLLEEINNFEDSITFRNDSISFDNAKTFYISKDYEMALSQLREIDETYIRPTDYVNSSSTLKAEIETSIRERNRLIPKFREALEQEYWRGTDLVKIPNRSIDGDISEYGEGNMDATDFKYYQVTESILLASVSISITGISIDYRNQNNFGQRVTTQFNDIWLFRSRNRYTRLEWFHYKRFHPDVNLGNNSTSNIDFFIKYYQNSDFVKYAGTYSNEDGEFKIYDIEENTAKVDAFVQIGHSSGDFTGFWGTFYENTLVIDNNENGCPCKLTLLLNANSITIEEDHCGAYSGAGAGFGGVFIKN